MVSFRIYYFTPWIKLNIYSSERCSYSIMKYKCYYHIIKINYSEQICSIFFQKGSHRVQPRDLQCSFFQFLSDKQEHDHHCLIPCFKLNLLIQFPSSYSITSHFLVWPLLDNFCVQIFPISTFTHFCFHAWIRTIPAHTPHRQWNSSL